MINRIEEEISKISNDLINIRKELHKNPELGYEEYETTNFIIKTLEKHDLKANRFKNITGAYVNIDNSKKGTIGLRVDIDALPVFEKTGVEFQSKNTNVMHACGHDVHTTIGIGTAMVLNSIRDQLPFNVKIIFQPAEECNPKGGAIPIMDEGVLENPKVDKILGFHVWPSLKVGEVGIKTGPILANSDKFRIIVNGKKSHGAEPYKGIDAINISMNIITKINNIKRNHIDPFQPAVISIGNINSNGRHNIICDRVEIEGTIRTFNKYNRDLIHKKISRIAKEESNLFYGNSEVEIEKGYDSVVNDKKLYEKFIKISRELIGEENLKTNINPSLIGEDFGFYGKKASSLYFLLGCESDFPLHSEKFIADDRCINEGVKLLINFFCLVV